MRVRISLSPRLTRFTMYLKNSDMKHFQEVPKFIPPEDPRFKEHVSEWQKSVDASERDKHQGYLYPAFRVEGEAIGRRTLESYHGEPFIPFVEEKIKATKRRVNVLDVGGGAGLFADQLRKKFEDKINVYTTGLRKKAAQIFRGALATEDQTEYKSPKSFKMDVPLHKNDLKWRSIIELSDVPEFDLICDTVGEFLYSTELSEKEKKGTKTTEHFSRQRIKKYLEIVVKKLLPGGHASIAYIPQEAVLSIEPVLDELRATNRKIKFNLVENDAPEKKSIEYILKIDKDV